MDPKRFSGIRSTLRDINSPVVPQPIRQAPKAIPRLVPASVRQRKTWVKKAKKYRTQLLVGVAVVIVALFVVNYMRTRNQLVKLADPKTASEQESAELVNVIGKFLELPEGESPTVVTVKNASQLRDQPFFARAKNGDKVLIFTDSGKAVLYRPSNKKVVEYSLVKLQDADTAQ